MKRKLNHIIYVVLAIFISVSTVVFTSSNTITADSYTDRSNTVSIVEATIRKEDGSTLHLDQSTNLNDYNNGVNPYEYVQLSVELHAELNDGNVFSPNDRFYIPMKLEGWSASDTTWEILNTDNELVKGKWRIANKTIEIELDADTATTPSINFTLSTGGAYMRWGGYTASEVIKNFTIGDATNASQVNYSFKSLKNALNKRDQDWSKILSSSNNTIQWYATLGQVNLADLWRNGGENVPTRSGFLEYPLVEGLEVTNIIVKTFINIPISLNPNSIGISTFPAWSMDITHELTRIDSSYEKETYQDFTKNLPVLSYGVYTDMDGNMTVAANYGVIGESGPTYAQLDPQFAAKAAQEAIDLGYYEQHQFDALKTQFEASYGIDNDYNGRVGGYVIYPTVRYETATADREITNIAYARIAGKVAALEHTAKLQGLGSTSGTTPYIATVIKEDGIDSSKIAGAEFKLQIVDNGTWRDYTPYNSASIFKLTNINGEASFVNLGYGTYRIVETKAADGYDITQTEGYDVSLNAAVSESFMVASNSATQFTFTFKNYRYLQINYAPGTHGTFNINTHEGLIMNQSTPAYSGLIDTNSTNPDNIGNPSGLPGYRFIGWSPVVENIVTRNITYVAQWESVPTNPLVSVEPNTPTGHINQSTPGVLPTTGINERNLVLFGSIVAGFGIVILLFSKRMKRKG